MRILGLVIKKDPFIIISLKNLQGVAHSYLFSSGDEETTWNLPCALRPQLNICGHFPTFVLLLKINLNASFKRSMMLGTLTIDTHAFSPGLNFCSHPVSVLLDLD